MNFLRDKSKLKIVRSLMVVFLGAPLLFFQNCSPASEEGGEETQGSSENPLFAYSVNVDTVAHMSCSNSSINKEAFFTYKVAALNAGSGLRFNDDFYKTIKGKPTATIQSMLSGHTINSEARLQLAVRSNSSRQNIRTAGGAGNDFYTHPAPLSSAVVVESLKSLETGESARFFSKATDLGSRTVEAAIYFNSEAVQTQLRSDLSNSEYSLALTFSDASVGTASNAIPVDLASPESGIYGRGLNLTFSSLAGTPNDVLRVVSGVSEVNLADGSDTGTTWSCPRSMVFKIYRRSDLDTDPNLCVRRMDKLGDFGAAENERIRVVRRMLDPEKNNWFIRFGDSANNYADNCIVSKALDNVCYGSGTQPISYSQSTCKDVNGAVTACPHFLSICTRQ